MSVSPARFLTACFRDIAPRFLFWSPRDRVCTKGVDEASTLKANHSLKPRPRPCVYDDSAVVQVARHNFPTYKHNYPLAYLCAATKCRAPISSSVFLDLGTLVIFPLSPLLPICFHHYLYVTPFGVRGSYFFYVSF